MGQNHPAKLIKADKSLQNKIGTGAIDPGAIQKCERALKSNSEDFIPLALEYLDNLKKSIHQAKDSDLNRDEAVKLMTASVMQLKANAAMFRYDLIGNLANVMLSFLEGVKEIDNGVIEIVKAHHTTLHAIVIKRMEGDGGEYGRQLENELKDVCKRYFSRKIPN